ncbi:antibiotic biosynthesis monooxygenase protein [Colletotrichum incanum]|uniref:Antibiotic biosynthesis monooxygenase protein n=1 Tax=Colletotrichum incanum TaxID=1573173 RepID=A0A162NZC1_COLIC|nr:antibiotic biosynthesis monooxygenase protein [Colletotrichum incanum]
MRDDRKETWRLFLVALAVRQDRQKGKVLSVETSQLGRGSESGCSTNEFIINLSQWRRTLPGVWFGLTIEDGGFVALGSATEPKATNSVKLPPSSPIWEMSKGRVPQVCVSPRPRREEPVCWVASEGRTPDEAPRWLRMFQNWGGEAKDYACGRPSKTGGGGKPAWNAVKPVFSPTLGKAQNPVGYGAYVGIVSSTTVPTPAILYSKANEPGTLRYEVHRGFKDENGDLEEFVARETYVNEEARNQHMGGPDVLALVEAIESGELIESLKVVNRKPDAE